jgi:hypothetical protein
MKASQRQPEKFILDATAGTRMMWFDKHHPNALYLDERPEVEPDIIADFRNLSQFPDKRFKLIVFDPPHYFRNERCHTGILPNQFGALNPDTWKSDLSRGFNELWRLLDDYGILVFKWSDYCMSACKALEQFPIKPLFYQITASGLKSTTKQKDGKHTAWFCFMKIPPHRNVGGG